MPEEQDFETISISRIVDAAEGKIPAEELTETEAMLTNFYLWAYERAFDDFIKGYRQKGDEIANEFIKNKEMTEGTDVVEVLSTNVSEDV